jgi:hypothetical protein
VDQVGQVLTLVTGQPHRIGDRVQHYPTQESGCVRAGVAR